MPIQLQREPGMRGLMWWRMNYRKAALLLREVLYR